jgi:hypothetical protein
MKGFETVFWTVGRTPWTKSRPVAKPLSTHNRTAQHRRTRTNIHTSSGIRTHDPSIQAVKTHTLDEVATVNGYFPTLPEEDNEKPQLG